MFEIIKLFQSVIFPLSSRKKKKKYFRVIHAFSKETRIISFRPLATRALRYIKRSEDYPGEKWRSFSCILPTPSYRVQYTAYRLDTCITRATCEAFRYTSIPEMYSSILKRGEKMHVALPGGVF